MHRAYYTAAIQEFLHSDPEKILGTLTQSSEFSVDLAQRFAWEAQIELLKKAVAAYSEQGKLYFEYAVPRLGKRIDVVAVIRSTVFILEFKVGAKDFERYARDQVWDYALDLKNFHETSHDKTLVPILVATNAAALPLQFEKSAIDDGVFRPVFATADTLGRAIEQALSWSSSESIRVEEWEAGRYRPTPTIVEAAMALYAGHGVAEIARNGAGERNLGATTAAIEQVIEDCRSHRRKAICFVTGVPGAGKTLVGLNIATQHAEAGELHSVFLSGNGPLVKVMQEALARDQVRREQASGRKVRKGQVSSRVKAFVQNVHHFRDEYLRDVGAPSDHIAVFDEAQRA